MEIDPIKYPQHARLALLYGAHSLAISLLEYMARGGYVIVDKTGGLADVNQMLMDFLGVDIKALCKEANERHELNQQNAIGDDLLKKLLKGGGP